MNRNQRFNNPWLLSPHRHCYGEIENSYKPHYTLDNLTPLERWESILFPGQSHDGPRDPLNEYANEFIIRGVALGSEGTPSGYNMQCEMVNGDETSSPEYPSDCIYSEIAFDHVSGACFPYTDPSHRSQTSAFSLSLQPRYRDMSKRFKRRV